MLAEADMGLTNMAFGGNSARFQGDETLLVKFFKHPRLNDGKSKEEGRPIYEEVDYIQIMQPGNKDSIIIRPATDMDKNRFAEHYNRYTARQQEDYIEGTLLEDWPGITRAMCEELRFFNVRTLEQLIAMSDTNAQGIMGINLLKDKAKSYLEEADSNAAAQALADQKAENERLLGLIGQLNNRLDELEAEEPKAAKKAKE